MRKLRSSRCAAATSARYVPSVLQGARRGRTRVARAAARSQPAVADRAVASELPALACAGSSPMRCIAGRAGGEDVGLRAAVARRTAPPADTSGATSRGRRDGPGSSRRPWRAPDARGTCPRSARRRSRPDPVHPFGLRSKSIGQRHRSPLAGASLALDRADGSVGSIHGLGHRHVRIVDARSTSTMLRGVPVAVEQVDELCIAHRGEDGGRGDLEAIEVQDRQDRARGRRIEELGAMPGRGGWTGFGLAVADDAGDDEIRIVECGAEGGCQRVTKLSALVDGARHGRAEVAGESARPGEGPHEPLEPPRSRVSPGRTRSASPRDRDWPDWPPRHGPAR